MRLEIDGLGPYRDGLPLLCGNVFYGAIDDVSLRQFHQVADAASDEALEDEDIALDIQPRFPRTMPGEGLIRR